MMVFIGFLCVILLVIAHEAGHFFAARRNGIDVEEFGIGFPPKAKVLTKKNGTEYTLNWLPLGGFVRLKGEHDSDTTPGSFGAARLRDKVKVMVAGVAVNFFIAFVLFSIIALVGMPQLVENQYTVKSDETVSRQDIITGFVDVGSPADSAIATSGSDGVTGIKENDVLRKITLDGCTTGECEYLLRTEDDLRNATKQLAAPGARTSILVDVSRGNTDLVFRTQLRSVTEVEEAIERGENIGYLGIIPTEFTTKKYGWSAPIVGAGTAVQLTGATLEGLGSIVSGLFRGDTEPATEQVSGVLGVGYIFSGASFLGPVFMLMIVAVISLSLAIMNILPIPALDGGRLFVTLFYRLIRRPLTKTVEERIHGTGFALLMVLFVLITILDVQRFVI